VSPKEPDSIAVKAVKAILFLPAVALAMVGVVLLAVASFVFIIGAALVSGLAALMGIGKERDDLFTKVEKGMGLAERIEERVAKGPLAKYIQEIIFNGSNGNVDHSAGSSRANPGRGLSGP
jgi:hypothetical protein